jgi:SAM-dependent methyltransferase
LAPVTLGKAADTLNAHPVPKTFMSAPIINAAGQDGRDGVLAGMPAPASSRVDASFNRAARRYGVHAAVQAAMAAWLGEWVPADRSGRALEFGAGTGSFTSRLLPWAGELVATDQSSAMCGEGRALLPGVDWRCLRAETPDSAGPCDWIFSCSMLQWIENPRAMFSAWKRVLNPGGRVLAGLFAEGSLPELRGHTHGWTPLTWRTPDEWTESLESAGLRLVRAQTQDRLFHHPNALEFMRSLHGTGAAPYHRFSPGRLRRIIRDYDRLHRDEHGVFSTWVLHRFEVERPA